jgi:orotidine-5'-phosphate decarboxylase
MNIDKLFESVRDKGHVCIGLDTAADYVPKSERQKAQNDAEAVFAFNKALIDTTFDITACYKVQIAYYEEMGLPGLKAYADTLSYIRKKNCLSIGDIKRGDIADTALRYAAAHFSGEFEADFVTLNPYMGMDSIEPWINAAKPGGKGAFVLMRTSNKGYKDFQKPLLTSGTSDASGTSSLYHLVGEKMSALAKQHKGKNGYGMFGVVVGCTEREEASEIRQMYKDLFFLIPGYGAQGGGAEDAALLLQDGNGGVVNASRSIITAWKTETNPDSATNITAAEAARAACVKMRDEIWEIVKK